MEAFLDAVLVPNDVATFGYGDPSVIVEVNKKSITIELSRDEKKEVSASTIRRLASQRR